MRQISTLFAILALLIALTSVATAEKIPYAPDKIEPPTGEYDASIEKAAPAKPTVAAEPRRVLVFSLFTGYDHKVTPHVDRVFEILGDKSGAYTATVTRDIEVFTPERLAGYDVVVLNNNCSKGARRNLFLDELERNAKYKDLTADQREAKAKALEDSLCAFVAGGKGLVAIHGAPTMLNNSSEFTGMVGAAFDFHPPNQEVTLRTVDAEHPLVAAFQGKGPFIHRDEPYCFNGPYDQTNFRPLLTMDTDKMRGLKAEAKKQVRYVAWIKPHGEGRVFYCSPSHFPQSYESTTMLQFILDDIQYAAGDLKCDDSPVK